MMTPNDPLLILWRSQPQNCHLTDAVICEAIATAYERVDRMATRQMTPGARDLAASYVLRLQLRPCDEKQALRDIVAMLTGGRP